MSGSVVGVRRLPVWVVLVAAVSLVLSLVVPVVAAPDAGAAQVPAAKDAPVAGAAVSADQAAPMVLVSSSGDQMTSVVPPAAMQQCKDKKKAKKQKVKKNQTKKIYKKKLRKAKKKAKRNDGKVSKKQKKRLKKQARKQANKKAKKKANRKYKQCLRNKTVTKIENVDFVLRSGAGAPTSADRVAMDAAALQGLGDEPIGRFAGQKVDGDPFDVPVRYSDISVEDGTLTLNWVSVNGGPGPRVREMTKLRAVDRSQLGTGGAPGGVGGKDFAYGSFIMQPKDAQTWRWSGAGGFEATASRSGSTVTASFKGSDSAGGLQPNGETSAFQWSVIQQRLARLVDGKVPTRLALWAVDQSGETSGAILQATDVKVVDGARVQVTGTLSPGSGDVASVVPDGGQRVVSALLETPNNSYNNPGAKEYVVITGDSIASGEGARYTGTYVNPQLAVQGQNLQIESGSNTDITKRSYENFCDWIDLSCQSATTTVEGSTPLDITTEFNSDPGIVYEEGSWEKAEQNQACHRSKTAPGTWLARYYETQKNMNVESINLACSGATTDNIVDTPFKGQPPQVQELDDLADYFPVTHVVNTIGANDINFSETAVGCFLAPVLALGIDPSSGLDFTALQQSIPRVMDDTRRLQDGTVVSTNPYFDVASLCSESKRAEVESGLQQARGKIAAAITALHEAAPEATIVQTNYPSLVPMSTKTYFPKNEFYSQALIYQSSYGPSARPNLTEAEGVEAWQDLMVRRGVDYWAGGQVLATPDAAVPFDENLSALAGAGNGNPVNDDMAYHMWCFNQDEMPLPGGGTLKTLCGRGTWNQISQVWLFNKTPLTSYLNYGALLFGYDQDWAAGEVIVGLNKTVLAAVDDADPNGAFTVPVDMTEVLNGRELGTKFNDSELVANSFGERDAPDQVILDVACFQQTPASPCGPGTGPGSADGPESQRAQFVNNVFPGLAADQGTAFPVICPDNADGDPDCLGDFQEAIHPNWRGQAAQGQCIVAVVTGELGQSGNACVRSVGDDNGAEEGKYKGDDYATDMGGVHLWSPVNGTDSLCLTPIPDTYSTESGQYTDCTGGTDADPIWDTQTWDKGKVDVNGTKVHWK